MGEINSISTNMIFETSNLLSALQPSLTVSKILGLCPAVTIYRSKVKYSRCGILYSFILCFAFIYFFLWADEGSTDPFHYPSKSVLEKTSRKISKYSAIVKVTVILGSSCYGQKRLFKLIKTIIQIDNEFSTLNIRISYARVKIFAILLLIVFFITEVLLDFMITFLLRPKSRHLQITTFSKPLKYSIPHCIKFQAVSEFLIFLLILHDRFRIVNKELMGLNEETLKKSSILIYKKDPLFINIRSQKKLNPKSKIEELSQLHDKLCDLSKEVNSLYSLSLLIVIGSIFLEVTFSLYITTTLLIRQKTRDVATVYITKKLYRAVSSIMMCIVLGAGCSITANAVSNLC